MSSEVRLTWEGRRAAQIPEDPPPILQRVSTWQDSPNAAAPAQLDLFEDGPAKVENGDWTHRLIYGDNLAAMAALKPEFAGKFDLIYLDPPFFTGRDFTSNANTSDNQSANLEIPYASSPIQFENRKSEIQNPLAYSDTWENLGAYLQWLFDRLTGIHNLLSETGCLYLHLSWHSAHYAKLLLDEIFGAEYFQNEIVWCYREAINSKKRWNRKHDTLLFYSKGEQFTFNYNTVREPYAEGNIRKYRHRDEKGAYRLMGRGITSSPLRSKRDLPKEYEALYPGLTYRHYLGEGTLPVDYWRIDIENQASPLRTGYPTQKPEALLEKILLASSNYGDLIGDFCCGSGTTLAVASRIGRRWIGCDSGAMAIQTTQGRVQKANTPFNLYDIEQSRTENGPLCGL